MALAERDAELTEARGLAARQERLASLATMAAGAAHELSTPLGTVALAAKELERALTRSETSGAPDGSELVADARLIREQVGRCRAILEQMAQGAGTVGEGVASCTIDELLDEALVGARSAPPVHREVPAELASVAAAAAAARGQPGAALADHQRPGRLAADLGGDDLGAQRRRATSSSRSATAAPGCRTRSWPGSASRSSPPSRPGRGMGLGLFLARAVIEAVGGSLQIDSVAGAGT